MLEVESSLLITQPREIGSLELERSNVTVVENLPNHDPPHIVRYHMALGLRTRCGYALPGSVITSVSFSDRT